MGDLNIDLLKSESCVFSNRFSEQFFTSSFFPLITRPTRITEHTAKLIDNIFTKYLEQIEYTGADPGFQMTGLLGAHN
jgi:hypothetical protein